MTRKMENPVLTGTGSEVLISGQLMNLDHTQNAGKLQHKLQVARLRHRFGLSEVRAALIARHAFGGGAS